MCVCVCVLDHSAKLINTHKAKSCANSPTRAHLTPLLSNKGRSRTERESSAERASLGGGRPRRIFHSSIRYYGSDY